MNISQIHVCIYFAASTTPPLVGCDINDRLRHHNDAVHSSTDRTHIAKKVVQSARVDDPQQQSVDVR